MLSGVDAIDVITRGYLPKELPPCFGSGSFAHAMDGKQPPEFDYGSSAGKKYRSLPAFHYLTRTGGTKRRLGIVNPVNMFQVAKFIGDNATTLLAKCQSDEHAHSTPRKGDPGMRAVVGTVEFRDQPNRRRQARTNARYCAVTDIAQFYPSIYTHALDWAVEGKANAKKLPKGTIGAELDRIVRLGQDNQTRGITIGSDVSFVLAEILLSAIDVEFDRLVTTLEKKEGFYINWCRSVDDYEIQAYRREDAEHCLAKLQDLFATYELESKPEKTKVIELPAPIEPAWQFDVAERAKAISAANPRANGRFVDGVFDYAARYPKDSVLSYAIKIVAGKQHSKKTVPAWQAFLLQSMAAEAGAMRYAVPVLAQLEKEFGPLERDPIKKLVHDVVTAQAHLRHGSEISWALWGGLQFGVKLSSDLIDLVLQTDDDVCLVLLAEYLQKGLTVVSPTWTALDQVVTAENLTTGGKWLSAYEIGMVRPAMHQKVLASDPAFDYLQKSGVRFFDGTADASQLPSDYGKAQGGSGSAVTGGWLSG